MDDWVIMCDNRWKFKRIIKKVFRILDNLKLEIAYEKTMVGRTETKCFDFLGFNVGIDGLRVAKKSVRKLAERIIMKLYTAKKVELSRVYDSGCLGANSLKGDLSVPENVSKYVRRWLIRIKTVNDKKENQVLEASTPF